MGDVGSLISGLRWDLPFPAHKPVRESVQWSVGRTCVVRAEGRLFLRLGHPIQACDRACGGRAAAMACLNRELLGVLVVVAASFVVGELASGAFVEAQANPRSNGVRIQTARGSALVLPLEGLKRNGVVNRRLEYEAQWDDARMTLHDDLLTKGCALKSLPFC
jgi:hypothetical protein